MMGDPPAKEYNTYVMQDGKPQNGAAPHYAQVGGGGILRFWSFRMFLMFLRI